MCAPVQNNFTVYKEQTSFLAFSLILVTKLNMIAEIINVFDIWHMSHSHVYTSMMASNAYRAVFTKT